MSFTLILSALIIVGFYYAIYKIIRYIFADLLDIYYSKKHQYEQPKDNSAETEFYKTVADIEKHLNDQGGFVDLGELGKLFRWRTA